MSTPLVPPAGFSEDQTWFPNDALFDRFPPGTDFGLMFTDGTYDVLVFEGGGPAAIEALADFDGAWDPNVGTSDSDTAVLLVFERASGTSIAAVQTWARVAELVESDSPRPATDASWKRRLGRAMRIVLALSAATLGALIWLFTADASGPVEISMVDNSTQLNPFPSGSRLQLSAGPEEGEVRFTTQTAATSTFESEIQWRLTAPLSIAFLSAEDLGESHQTDLDLRATGVTPLSSGQAVFIEITAWDDRVEMSVERPRWRFFGGSDREVTYWATLNRTMPTVPMDTPVLLSPAQSECVSQEIDRFFPLRNDFDVSDRVSQIRNDARDNVVNPADRGAEISRRLDSLQEETVSFFYESGLGASRPAGSLLSINFDLLMGALERLADSYADPRIAGEPEVLRSAFTEQSAGFGTRFYSYLESDAIENCAE